MGSFVSLGTEDSDISIALVIGKNDHHIRKTFLCRNRFVGEKRAGENEKGENSDHKGFESS
jgi:hypothetical protein